ncbi:MAG: histidine kinase [Anaerolineales bacterium]|nr:histidine kinase [Anaerolineales bacterium]
MMSNQTARHLAWSITLISVALVTIGLAMSILALSAAENHLTPFPHQFFTPLLTVAYGVAGTLVATRYPRNLIGWMFCVTGFLSALNMLSVGYSVYDQHIMTLPGGELAQWLTIWVWIPNVLLPITFLLLLFPDGQLPTTRWRPVAWAAGLGIVMIITVVAFYPRPLEELGHTEVNPFGITGSAGFLTALMVIATPLLVVGIVGSIASIILRFRHTVGIAHVQLKWIAFAGVMVIVGNIVGSIPWLLWPDNPLSEEASIIATDFTIAGIVVATGIAILRYRLWDIDIVINRTLVYGSLTTLILGMYVLIVGSLGSLFQNRGSLPLSLFATGIVAMSFQPLRQHLQQDVNRLMFGERDDPYAVLARLSARLEAVVTAQVVLPTIVEGVAEALKLPYAAIALKENEQFTVTAEYVRSSTWTRKPDHDMDILPLVYQSEMIGQLRVAPRTRGEPFSLADRQLLETIARQTGVAAFNVRLTQDLQRSRERLVTAREEERRRLRRDLHDGLGPTLAAMSFKLDASANLIGHDSERAQAMIAELKAQIQTVLADIRRIAHNLRPPTLDQLGLVGALQEHIAANYTHGLHITLEAPETLPTLAAAVEVAAYRITLEAIHNVNQHAYAQHCWVRLSYGENLCLEISDDGCGIPTHLQLGVGMISMRERTEELGGTCVFSAHPRQGTCVMVQLPLMTDSYHEGESWNPSES